MNITIAKVADRMDEVLGQRVMVGGVAAGRVRKGDYGRWWSYELGTGKRLGPYHTRKQAAEAIVDRRDRAMRRLMEA